METAASNLLFRTIVEKEKKRMVKLLRELRRGVRVRRCKAFSYQVFYSAEDKGYVADVVCVTGMNDKKRGVSISTTGSKKEVAARRLRKLMADLLVYDRDLFFGKGRT
ncbi:MAG: hypothetical protein Q7R73_00735 [bacterium]|nr:hypothetical protein [bacterium]